MSGLSQPFRVKQPRFGEAIDRSKELHFTFNGRSYAGYEGDTLASAMIANGVRLVGRSFKYHRPRGIFSAGSEEPNALLTLGRDAEQEPNCRATTTPLHDGLEASSQNHRGPLKYDLMAVNDWLSPVLSAGFYYKTFMWPKAFWEKVYEPVIRASAGLGRLSGKPDPNLYDKGFLHCDVLVIGAGPAGLLAARDLGRAGLRVIIADDDFLPGGRLNSDDSEVDGGSGGQWAALTWSELAGMPNVRCMPRTVVYGAFDHGIYGALEQCDIGNRMPSRKPRQILWRIYAKRSLLAAGSTERPIAFANNDRPGIMLAGAVRTYANRYGAVAGRNITVFTNNDDGWRTAEDLKKHGATIAAVIDVRSEDNTPAVDGVEAIRGCTVTKTRGRHGLRQIELDNGRRIETDCLAVSGGWNPNVHLTCHQRGRPVWQDSINAFVPGSELPTGMSVAGAAAGVFQLGKVFENARRISTAIISDASGRTPSDSLPQAKDEASGSTAFWYVKDCEGRAWVDYQNDVTVKDIQQSHLEGFRSVEHVKRYTTLGMATDQGKTSNITGLAVLADISGKSIADTGTTIFRPPYVPVAIGAFAGRSRGKHFRPTRLTPSHRWAEAQGAIFVEAGLWLRAQWFARPGETHWRESVDREVLAVRNAVGICDVSTLGKIDVQGKDAAEFLNRIYVNGFTKLAAGKVRYGLMLREDGIAMDDGTAARFSETHFVVTTTTANAVPVFRHMEFCRQCLWPDLDVHLISVTEQWGQFAVAGPKSRDLLMKIVDPQHDLSDAAFPFMACKEVTVCGGISARLFRISFSGERAYEIAIPARYGDSFARRLMEAGETFGATPYGTEALSVLRIEKGHPVANELNGQTTARDLGMEGMLSSKKDFVGKVLAGRKELNREDGFRLVGFKPVDRSRMLRAGAHFVERGSEANTENDLGWMSSVAFSPTLGHSIGLGFIRAGNTRIGDVVTAADPLRKETIDVEIVSQHFIDPTGERMRG